MKEIKITKRTIIIQSLEAETERTKQVKFNQGYHIYLRTEYSEKPRMLPFTYQLKRGKVFSIEGAIKFIKAYRQHNHIDCLELVL